MRKRLVIAALGLPVLALALSGCMELTASTVIHSDDNIEMSVTIGVDKSTADLMSQSGQTLTGDSLCQELTQDSSGSGLPSNVTTKDVSNDQYVACQISGTTTLDQESDTITHEDGTYQFSMSSGDVAGADDSSLSAAMFDTFEVSVTFPGAVIEHDGSSTVSGTTVTWTDPNDLFSSDGLQASGYDTASGVGGIPLWAIIAIVVVVVAAIVVILLVVLHKRSHARTYPQVGPQGFGPYPGYPPAPPAGVAAYPSAYPSAPAAGPAPYPYPYPAPPAPPAGQAAYPAPPMPPAGQPPYPAPPAPPADQPLYPAPPMPPAPPVDQPPVPAPPAPSAPFAPEQDVPPVPPEQELPPAPPAPPAE
ncbi:MAG: hypothetical protein FWF28_05005 [Micrococcales bacterium]|nr:hypothetical protein [Micrococcales bacterium]